MASPSPVARLEWLARIAVDPDAPKSAVAVAAVLATFPTAPGGELFPSVPGLAQRAMLTKRGAQKAIAWLSHPDHPYLAVAQGGGRGFKNVFRILETVNGGSPIPDTKTANSGSPNSDQKGEPQGTKGRTAEPKTANSGSPDPGNEPGYEPGRSAGATLDVERWEKRSGQYGKGALQRKEAIERLRELGATNEHMRKLFASLPSHGSLGKLEAAEKFDAAVDQLAESLGGGSTSNANYSTRLSDDEQWRQRLKGWKRIGLWLSSWGPKPGHAECRVPKAVLVEALSPAVTVNGAETHGHA